ncbi:hypothetical protein V8G54_000526 [Vigna mungo]|uniref:peptide-methionine (S)-S-oxide reductase n=1 Tax=Vigna mungo TaxID=3915 RepID=A0AAQ3P796_VIGMU
MAVPEMNHNHSYHHHKVFSVLIVLFLLLVDNALCIRFPDRVSQSALDQSDQERLQVAVFALGSFWRSEAVFGCLPGVVRTTVGYAGGSKSNPEYRSLGDHAESVKVEYDPQLITFRELLDIFWSSHDPRQVYGQGRRNPDLNHHFCDPPHIQRLAECYILNKNLYSCRSIIFVNGTEEGRMAAVSKEQEQTRSRSSIVTTQILQLGTFYPAESEHQVKMRKFKGWMTWKKVKKHYQLCDQKRLKIMVLLFSRGKMEVRTDKELDYANKHFWADALVFQQRDGSVWLHTSNRTPEEPNNPNLIGDILIADGAQMVNGRDSRMVPKFELKQNTILLQLIGNLPAEELERSSLATKLNGYVAELCPPDIQKRIDAKINDIIKRGWPILRDL